MSINLNRPSLGSTNWFDDVDGNWQIIQDAVNTSTPVGVLLPYVGTSAPTGWLICNGGTIGNASSNATARANPDTQSLFTLLWAWSDADAPLKLSDGITLTTRAAQGSAVGAFNNNCQMTLPNLARRVPVGSGGTGTGTLGDAVGNTGGTETHTLTSAQSGLPAHNHSATSGTQSANHTHTGTSGIESTGHSHTVNAHRHDIYIYTNYGLGSGGYAASWTNASLGTDRSNGGQATLDVSPGTSGVSLNHTHTTTTGAESANHSHTITVNNNTAANASQAHNNIQPSLVTTYIIKY